MEHSLRPGRPFPSATGPQLVRPDSWDGLGSSARRSVAELRPATRAATWREERVGGGGGVGYAGYCGLSSSVRAEAKNVAFGVVQMAVTLAHFSEKSWTRDARDLRWCDLLLGPLVKERSYVCHRRLILEDV